MSSKSAAPPRVTISTISPSATRGDLMRIVWTLAWPAIMTFGLESLVGLVDMLMVGRLGANAVAGVGVGTQILNAVSVMNLALATGTVALVARHVGATERPTAEAVLQQSIYVAVPLALTIPVAVSLWAPQLVGIFKVGHSAGEQDRLRAHDHARCALDGDVRGDRGRAAQRRRHAHAAMIGALVNVLNVALRYAHLRQVRAAGAGRARLGAGQRDRLHDRHPPALGSLLRTTSVLRLRRAHMRPNLALARRVIGVGSPTGLEQLLMQIGFLLYLSIAVRYGTSAVAAYFIGVRILALSFLPGFGFGAPARTIVGQPAPPAHSAERSGWGLAMALMSLAGLVIFSLCATDRPAIHQTRMWSRTRSASSTASPRRNP
jgi:Na+-driven multidrug efflux pump